MENKERLSFTQPSKTQLGERKKTGKFQTGDQKTTTKKRICNTKKQQEEFKKEVFFPLSLSLCVSCKSCASTFDTHTHGEEDDIPKIDKDLCK